MITAAWWALALWPAGDSTRVARRHARRLLRRARRWSAQLRRLALSHRRTCRTAGHARHHRRPLAGRRPAGHGSMARARPHGMDGNSGAHAVRRHRGIGRGGASPPGHCRRAPRFTGEGGRLRGARNAARRPARRVNLRSRPHGTVHRHGGVRPLRDRLPDDRAARDERAHRGWTSVDAAVHRDGRPVAGYRRTTADDRAPVGAHADGSRAVGRCRRRGADARCAQRRALARPRHRRRRPRRRRAAARRTRARDATIRRRRARLTAALVAAVRY